MALCIGIDEYKRAGDRLKGAVKDAKLWSDVLGAAGFAVTLLTDRDATRNGVLGSIYKMVTSARAGDSLVVQYSGHGTYAPDPTAEEEDSQDEAICPVDFRDGNVILDDDLAKLWDLIPDDVSLTIFFDSCHSGGANRDVGADGVESIARGVQLEDADKRRFLVARGFAAPNGMQRALEAVTGSETAEAERPDEASRGREVLFAACRSRQLAWETNGQGDFTRFVAPLLANSIGKVSNREFFDAITAGFDAFRQVPSFAAAPRRADALLLAAAAVGEERPSKPAGDDQPEVPTAKHGGRDAAIAAILRGVADLLES